MKRALAVCTVLAVLGFSAFGIGTFTGKWDASILLIGTGAPALNSTNLTLSYTDFGWTITGVFSFGSGGLSSAKFTTKGALGPFSLTGNMWFSASPSPAYLRSDLATSLDFAGLSLGFTVRHWMPNKYGWGTNPCTATDTGMEYILTTTIDPISLKLRFVDCCTGIAFYDAVITLKGLGLCCGISLNAELAFSKVDGFKYLKFTGIQIPLCCGVSLTASVEFTTRGKSLSTGLKFAGFGDTCFTVYADAVPIKDNANNVIGWQGIEIYGYKIKCSLGDCNYVEFLTALNVDKVESILGDTTIFTGDEFEYMKLGFCGAGCCGGQYTVALSVYFKTGTALFGISRIGADMSIPIMSNLTVNVSFSSSPTLTVGWVFTF